MLHTHVQGRIQKIGMGFQTQEKFGGTKEPILYIRKVLGSCVNFVYCNGSRSKQRILPLPGRWEHLFMLLFLPEISVHILRQWDKIRCWKEPSCFQKPGRDLKKLAGDSGLQKANFFLEPPENPLEPLGGSSKGVLVFRRSHYFINIYDSCNAVTPALKCVLIYFISSLVSSPLGTSRLLYDGVDYDSSVLCTLQYRTSCI